MHRVEWPEAELILEELEDRYKRSKKLDHNIDLCLVDYDPDDMTRLKVDGTAAGCIVDLKSFYNVVTELKFRIFQRMANGPKTA